MTTKNEENNKKKNYLHIKLILIMLVITSIAFVWNKTINNEISYAVSGEIKMANEVTKQYKKMETSDIDFDNTIEQNRKKQEEQIVVEEVDLEYTTTYQNSEELSKDTLQVLQEGKMGKQQQITKKVFENGELVKEEPVGTKVTTSSIDRIVLVGTANYKSNYKVKKGDTVYVTSHTLDVRREQSEGSERVYVLKQKDSVQILQIGNDWYKIAYGNYSGWVKKDCVTYINPNAPQDEAGAGGYTKSQLLAKLSKNMKLNTPSGFTLEQFKKVLSNNSQDSNRILQNNAQYFYYIEKQYKINGVFVAAVAIHESNWGTSKLATTKNNLFGYGAYDRDPSGSAYNFATHAEGIDLLGRVFMKYYLNPAGTKLYGGEVATGKYYNGQTLQAVNKRYASDKNWANGVYKWMEYLYNRL